MNKAATHPLKLSPETRRTVRTPEVLARLFNVLGASHARTQMRETERPLAPARRRLHFQVQCVCIWAGVFEMMIQRQTDPLTEADNPLTRSAK